MLNNLIRFATGKPALRCLNETITAFLAGYENMSTRTTYEQVLRPFAEDIGPQRALEAITPEDVDIWYQRLPLTTLAAATIVKRMKAVKVFWNWCVKREYITRSPARFLVIKQPQRIMVSKAIPGDVLAAMFEAAQQKRCEFMAVRDTALLALLITFGARVGEVAHLRLNNIFLEGRQILFHGKGNKERVLPLPYRTKQHLADWLEMRATLRPKPEHDYVFVNSRIHLNPRYGPLATSSIATLVRRLSMQVGSTSYGPHAIRHWRGQTLADQRIAPTIVQAILGHSDVRITLEYYYNQDLSRIEWVLGAYELGRGRVDLRSSERLPLM
jgi:site-specific recombinase XerD